MGSLIYQKAFRKQLKTSYGYLDENQKKYIKAKEKFEQMDKALNYFYSQCGKFVLSGDTYEECYNDLVDMLVAEAKAEIRMETIRERVSA